MEALIQAIFAPFLAFMESIPQGFKTAVTNLLYDVTEGSNGAQVKTISDFAIFAFSMMGIGLALGVVYSVVRWVRNR